MNVKLIIFHRKNAMLDRYHASGFLDAPGALATQIGNRVGVEGMLISGLTIGRSMNAPYESAVSGFGNAKDKCRIGIRNKSFGFHPPADRTGHAIIEVEEPKEGLLTLPPLGVKDFAWEKPQETWWTRRKKRPVDGVPNPAVSRGKLVPVVAAAPQRLVDLGELDSARRFLNTVAATGMIEYRQGGPDGPILQGPIWMGLKLPQ